MKRIAIFLLFNLLFLNLNNKTKKDTPPLVFDQNVPEERVVNAYSKPYSIKYIINNYYDKNSSIGLDVFVKGLFKDIPNASFIVDALYINKELQDTKINDLGKTGYANIYFENNVNDYGMNAFPTHKVQIGKEEYNSTNHRSYNKNININNDYSFYQLSHNEVAESHTSKKDFLVMPNNEIDKEYYKLSFTLDFSNISSGTYGMFFVGFGWFLFEPKTFNLTAGHDDYQIEFKSIFAYTYISYYVGDDYVLFHRYSLLNQINENRSIEDVKNSFKNKISIVSDSVWLDEGE